MRPSPETGAETIAVLLEAIAVLLEALERAAENMKRAAEFHGCSNCREGEKLARAAIRKVRGEGKA